MLGLFQYRTAMHIQECLHRNVKTIAMPLAMVVGAVLCRPVASIDDWSGHMVTPVLIFLMLFVTFCRVKPREMRPSMLHVWLLAIQIAGCVAIYLALRPLNTVVAQGAMICILAPVAMAAVVIAGMLGADVATMATYSLLCNMAIAVAAPVVLSFTGNGECSFGIILAKVAPLLIGPFVAGQFCRAFVKPLARWVSEHKRLSFYLWLLSLVVIIGRTTSFIIERGTAESNLEIALAMAALVICLAQFAIGRHIGIKYGDKVAGGQSLGQKNTVLAVWMSQSFMDPLSCVAPTAYIVWQNFVNSYQIYKHSDL